MNHRISAALVILCAVGCQQAELPAEDLEDTAEHSHALTSPVAGAVAKPAGWAIVPPWANGVSHQLTQTYGTNLHRNTNLPGNSNDHYALDINLALNEAVFPVADGTVIYAGPASGGWASYGNIVFLNHVVAGVNYQSLYAHLASTAVSGGAVTTGTMIGRAGNSGTAAVHLHLALYRGASFQNVAGARGPFGGNSVVPEAFSQCTKGGGSCENLATGNVLVKTSTPPPPPPCGAPCTQCVFNVRPDILPFYQANGWDISCWNRDAILTNWCSIDPAGCASARAQCAGTCSTCGSTCTQCILQQRTDILPFYQANGWDISCGNRNAIVNNWCTGLDPSACNSLRTGTCRSSCP